MSSTNVIMTIAKKEFADKLHEKSIVIMGAIFMIALFVYTQTYATSGFMNVVQTVAIFFPLLGIALGYDSIVMERKSNSLGVLLTHPVFRDKLIAGKILGLSFSALFVVFLSLTLIMAADLLISGKIASFESMLRIYIFGVFTFLYLSIYISLGFLSSVICKSEISSLTFGVIIWINLCFALGSTILMLTSLITGVHMFSGAPEYLSTGYKLLHVSPIHYFSELVCGWQDMSYGSFGWQPEVNGFLDTDYTLSYLINYYKWNILFLLVAPIFLVMIAYGVFLREDI